jgi:hypothetical protein
MRRQVVTAILVASVALLGVSRETVAVVTSKTYEYKPDVKLETGVDIGQGLKLESVLFKSPSSIGKKLWSSGILKADITVTNLGVDARKFGIAVALFDDEGRLLGVASHGTTFPLKPERQAIYTLDFTNVNSELFKATKFKISIEPKF